MKRLSLTIPFLALLATGCSSLAGVQPIKVKGTAMVPALKDGETIFIDRKFDKLERGDIVIFYFPDDQSFSYIKRIVALPGETVEMREGEVVVNGTVLQEPYVDRRFNLSHRSSQPILLSKDNYYVMGDNRDNSSDSRIWGPLHRKFIYGKYTRHYSRSD